MYVNSLLKRWANVVLPPPFFPFRLLADVLFPRSTIHRDSFARRKRRKCRPAFERATCDFASHICSSRSTSPASNSSAPWLSDLFLAEMASWVDVCSCGSNCPLSNPPLFPLPNRSSQFRLGYLTNLVVKVTRKMGIMECKSVKVFRITFRQNLWHVACFMEKFAYGLTQSVFYFKSACLKPETPYIFLGKSHILHLKKVGETVCGVCIKVLCKTGFIID
jgi:hypothetical protein